MPFTEEGRLRRLIELGKQLGYSDDVEHFSKELEELTNTRGTSNV